MPTPEQCSNTSNGSGEHPTSEKVVGGYKKIRDLGMGSFGKAILVQHRETGQRCVMKAVDITRLQGRQREQSINEVKLLGSIKHPFIIGYRESFIVNGFLCIITDFADGGDLFAAIKKRKETSRVFSERQIIRWLIQCALALKHLHEMHILHRDVKSQNIFLSASGRIRLGDFGIAKALDTTASFARTMIGTPYYLSPEICKSQPYSWASDIWSLGCVLYEICALKVPFEAPNMRSLVARIVDGRPPLLPLHFSTELRAIYNKMLAKNPHDRPTAAELLCEPLLRRECAAMLREETGSELCSLEEMAMLTPQKSIPRQPTFGLPETARTALGRSPHGKLVEHLNGRKEPWKLPAPLTRERLLVSGAADRHKKFNAVSALLKPFRWAYSLRKPRFGGGR